jgi:hypothetical protein
MKRSVTHVLTILSVVFLGSCGPAGPTQQEEKRPESSRGPEQLLRFVEIQCQSSTCEIACNANERIVSMHALKSAGSFALESESRASYRAHRGVTRSKIVLVCTLAKR